MRDLTISVNVSSFTSGDTVTLSSIDIKSKTNITYTLNNIAESDSEALFLDIDWGDGSPIERYSRPALVDYRTANIIDEIVYNKPLGSILTSKSHLYYNNTSFFNSSIVMQMLIIYKDNSSLKIEQPINIYQSSYYDEVGDLDILSAQIMPLSTNNTFINLEGKLSNYTYVAALDTYNRYGSSPIIVDDNTAEGCNIIDLYKDYDLPYYDT
jgi:hypothetical protein